LAIIGKLDTFTPSLVPQAGPERVLLVLSHFAGVVAGLFRDTLRACRPANSLKTEIQQRVFNFPSRFRRAAGTRSCPCCAGPGRHSVPARRAPRASERPSRILPALTAGLRAALRRLRPSGCAPFGTIAAGQNASPLPPEPDGSEGVCPVGAAPLPEAGRWLRAAVPGTVAAVRTVLELRMPGRLAIADLIRGGCRLGAAMTGLAREEGWDCSKRRAELKERPVPDHASNRSSDRPRCKRPNNTVPTFARIIKVIIHFARTSWCNPRKLCNL